MIAITLGLRASSRCHTSLAPAGGSSGSMSKTSPPDSTTVHVITGCQSSAGFQCGCDMRQSHSPGATSITSHVLATVVTSAR
jgi:hypothetical protein